MRSSSITGMLKRSSCYHGRTDGWTDGQTDGRRDERTDGWMDGWMDGILRVWMRCERGGLRFLFLVPVSSTQQGEKSVGARFPPEKPPVAVPPKKTPVAAPAQKPAGGCSRPKTRRWPLPPNNPPVAAPTQ
eukprot:254875-Chlamydomonas_euryale.AAC.2